jgi:hypothetical protein
MVCLAAGSALAQLHRVDARNMYERVIAVVPMTGSGTDADPYRPMFAPKPGDMNPASATAIAGFNYELSDDGKFALVQFVARDKAAFQTLLAAGVPTFVKGTAAATIVAALQQYRKSFRLTDIDVFVP